LFTVCLLSWVLFYLIPLAPGLIMRAVFDTLTGKAPAVLGVWSLLALLLVAEAGRVGVFRLGVYTLFTFWYLAAGLMRGNVMGWIVRGEGTRVLPDSPGELVSRFRDDVDEVLWFIDVWLDSVGLALFGAVAIIIMMQISPTITAVVALPIIGVFFITQALSAYIRKYRERSRATTGRVTGFISDMFSSVLAIKTAAAEERVVQYFQKLGAARSKAALRDKMFTELLDTLHLNTANLSIGIILLIAAQSMRAGDFSIGDFTLFTSYIGALVGLPRFVGRLLARSKQASVSIERMVAMPAGTTPERLVAWEAEGAEGGLGTLGTVGTLGTLGSGGTVGTEGAVVRLDTLSAHGLTYRYPGSERGIDNVSFTIRRGGFTVITGRIGAGKTTLVRVLLGLLPHDAGEIRWNGQIVADPAAFFVPPRSAYTPQAPRLFSDTLRDNMLMGLPDGVDADAVPATDGDIVPNTRRGGT
jgi:ATP-binding cassette subfamily B protein